MIPGSTGARCLLFKIPQRCRDIAPMQNGAEFFAQEFTGRAFIYLFVAMQNRKPSWFQHLRHELPAQMAFQFALRPAIPAQHFAEQRLRITRTSLAQAFFKLRQDDALNNLLQHLIARNAEAFAEILVRFNFLPGFGGIGADHQIRGAAANINARHTQRRRLAIAFPRAPGQCEEARGITTQALACFGIQEHQLRRRRLIKVGNDARFRWRRGGARRGIAPAHHIPGKPDRGFGAMAENTLFRERHCWRHGQQNTP